MSRIAMTALTCLIFFAFATSGCGNGSEKSTVLQEEGILTGDEAPDPYHGQLPYDHFRFTASSLDTVSVLVDTDEFVPLLRLMEVATGAVIDEWDAGYSDRDHMEYTIALSGQYEVRVYSTDDGLGEYSLTVTVR